MLVIVRSLVYGLALALGGVPATAQTVDPPSDAPAAEQTATVSLRGDRFHPARISVPAGTTVVWSNDEDDPENAHNVISRDYRWASSDFLPGETYQRTFAAPGEYRYFCDLHGGMVGRVTVE
jgi:plastocyanin